jgi:hypothetical protein
LLAPYIISNQYQLKGSNLNLPTHLEKADSILIREYNKACQAGHNDVFYRNPQYLRPFTKQSKFYAARFFCGAYNSTGGIRINYKAEVLTKDFEVSPDYMLRGLMPMLCILTVIHR